MAKPDVEMDDRIETGGAHSRSADFRPTEAVTSIGKTMHTRLLHPQRPNVAICMRSSAVPGLRSE